MKILNLYAGIGGNRKLWGDEHQVTAIENSSEIAFVYRQNFPHDNCIIMDAHQYLLDHFREFDFIWSSPPCPSHSIVRKITSDEKFKGMAGYNKPVYPDIKLYEEILFLKGYFKGKWCVENVISWYEPLIDPYKIAGHYFWTNFIIRDFVGTGRNHYGTISSLSETKGFDLKGKKLSDKRKVLRNCVEPELGKHIFDFVINPISLTDNLFGVDKSLT